MIHHFEMSPIQSRQNLMGQSLTDQNLMGQSLTGQNLVDLILVLSLADLNFRLHADGWIAWDQTKTDKRIEMPILPALKEAIDAHPVTGLHFIVTAYGKPFSADGFGSKMKQWTQEAGLPGRCASHGLRKALAARLAEGGATDEQIASILGHSDTRSTKTYTRSADQKRLAEAAMRTIEGQSVPLGETLSRHVRQNGDKSQ